MGGVCAAVYLLLMIVFIPFLFYPDIKYATSGGGAVDLEAASSEHGRQLHKFPLAKVRTNGNRYEVTLNGTWLTQAHSWPPINRPCCR